MLDAPPKPFVIATGSGSSQGCPDRGLFGFTLRVIFNKKTQSCNSFVTPSLKKPKEKFHDCHFFDTPHPPPPPTHITHLCELYSTRLCKNINPLVYAAIPFLQ
ncbi:hypothetical protein CHARACLAT_006936 [Characodon lateralis]|uniref:Uncharacterized protein n=1 Tax=Characodon lateralis TaxID=208331 RepID=A0ABU7ESQ6_9TELE|nr:hypothetical protein [Characodon lateralis]